MSDVDSEERADDSEDTLNIYCMFTDFACYFDSVSCHAPNIPVHSRERRHCRLRKRPATLASPLPATVITILSAPPFAPFLPVITVISVALFAVC